MKPCAWCDQDYTPTHRNQRCCTRQHSALLRQAQARQQPDYQPPRSNWHRYPAKTTTRGYGAAHQRLRKQLLPTAIGTPCPLCGYIMQATQRLALDHRIPVALGGPTTLANVRITHYHCNHKAGSRLGAALSNLSR
jgi:5-methylcytosine-specific restriction endonuclease McrA